MSNPDYTPKKVDKPVYVPPVRKEDLPHKPVEPFKPGPDFDAPKPFDAPAKPAYTPPVRKDDYPQPNPSPFAPVKPADEVSVPTSTDQGPVTRIPHVPNPDPTRSDLR